MTVLLQGTIVKKGNTQKISYYTINFSGWIIGSGGIKIVGSASVVKHMQTIRDKINDIDQGIHGCMLRLK